MTGLICLIFPILFLSGGGSASPLVNTTTVMLGGLPAFAIDPSDPLYANKTRVGKDLSCNGCNIYVDNSYLSGGWGEDEEECEKDKLAQCAYSKCHYRTTSGHSMCNDDVSPLHFYTGYETSGKDGCSALKSKVWCCLMGQYCKRSGCDDIDTTKHAYKWCVNNFGDKYTYIKSDWCSSAGNGKYHRNCCKWKC